MGKRKIIMIITVCCLLALVVSIAVMTNKDKGSSNSKKKNAAQTKETFDGKKIESDYEIICEENDFDSLEIKDKNISLNLQIDNGVILDGGEIVLYDDSVSINFKKDIKTKYNNSSECCYVVPTEYKGKKIASVTNVECDSAKEIYYPDGLLLLEGGINSKNAKTIYFPASINFFPFDQIMCPSLKKVVFADNNNACFAPSFCSCNELEEIKLPDSIKYLYSNSFSDCNSLKKIELPLNLESIYIRAINNCPKLKELDIPDSVTFMEETDDDYVFKNSDITLIVGSGSYAEEFAKNHGISCKIRG